MRALVVDHPGALVSAELPPPEPGEYDALVRIAVCGICNSTDTNLIAGKMPYHAQYPAILGHESVGEVISVGSKCRTLRPGMRFTRPTAVFPGSMTSQGLASAWGGFAQYGLVRDRLALLADGDEQAATSDTLLHQCSVPEGLTDVQAALAISIAEVASWVDQAGNLRGKNVVVLGTGIAGLAMVWLAKHAGAEKVLCIGRRAERVAKARIVGADEALITGADVVAQVRDVTDGGADFLFEATGNADGLQSNLATLGPGGRVLIYGMSEGYVYRLPLLAAPPGFSLHVPQPREHLAYHHVCEMMLSGELPAWQFISHEWPLPQSFQAFDQVRRGEVLKGFISLQ